MQFRFMAGVVVIMPPVVSTVLMVVRVGAGAM